MLAMLGRLTPQAVREIAAALAEALHWSDQQKESEMARALEILADRHQVRLEDPRV